VLAASLIFGWRAPGASAAPAYPATAVPTDTAAFTLFGWLSPPADSTNLDRIGQMSALSFNLTLPAWLDQGKVADNLARLDWAGAHGMRCLIWDDRMNGAWHWLPTFEDTLDRIVADYQDHPAFWGYYLGDEPPSWEWPLLHRLREALRQRDPIHPAWNNLSGRVIYPSRAAYEDTLRGYADAVSPAVMCADHYDFTVTGDRGQFVENIVALREVADSRGLPFWGIVQLIPHQVYRELKPGELLWQVSQFLAYGARGIGYFTYWPPEPDPNYNWGRTIIGSDGKPTRWYDFLLSCNRGVRTAGQALAGSRWIRTTHSGSVPLSGVAFTPDDWIAGVEGRAAIGEFEGPAGQRYVLVANSDSLAPRLVTLQLRDTDGASIIASGYPRIVPLSLSAASSQLPVGLEGGDFVLLALNPPAPPPQPSFAVTPNPAGPSVTFSLKVTWPNARLEILEANGRRIWSRPVAEGAGTLVWRGERDSGGTATPGIYFVRVTGAGAASTRRFAWMGAR